MYVVPAPYVLGSLFVLAGVVTLASVVGTVFLWITVAYLLWPVRRRLVARGWTPRVASLLSAELDPPPLDDAPSPESSGDAPDRQ
ncbi:hypothetical protein [Halobellus ruber]|uniref:Uncharacterized protein n=1 Tax=Halobellus ruber TaxID=2761102 RepID=A0A7J9SL80_9EURY|nr:hypothetical protein [Halobellus ruber]MBB6647272.1 hypothetical protein [Halobellus ruber]